MTGSQAAHAQSENNLLETSTILHFLRQAGSGVR
jgi:hypothetical protein